MAILYICVANLLQIRYKFCNANLNSYGYSIILFGHTKSKKRRNFPDKAVCKS